MVGGVGAVSTLELTSSSSGTLSGLGSQFVNFGSLKVDPSAKWTLGGSNDLVDGAVLANAGTLVVSGNNGITLSGSAAFNQTTISSQISNATGNAIYGDATSGNASVSNYGVITGGGGPSAG